MSLPSRFRAYIATHGLLGAAQRVVVGVSGGLDSTVLLYLLVEEEGDVVAAHVNYGLRGTAADADEALIRRTCETLGVPLTVDRPRLNAGNTQQQARDARYAFFEQVANEHGASAVAVAHHRDDQAETLLMNLARGAGPVGLAGMPPCRHLDPASEVMLVRPLLFASRDEIRAYAVGRGIEWREDATNRKSDYRRTALRTVVLPALDRVFPGAADRLADTAKMMRAYLDSGAPLAAGLGLEGFAEPVPDGWSLPVDALRHHPPVVRYGIWIEALRRWAPDAPRSAATARELDRLLDAQPGRRVEWVGVRVWRDRNRIIFEEAVGEGDEPVRVEMGTTRAAGGTLRVEPVARPERFDPSPLVEYADADRLTFPLVLRLWRAGDRLVPLGMEGTKKVSDLLTDRSVPTHERARQRVLLKGDEIVWVVGHRLAAPFQVRPDMPRVVRLEWQPGKAVDGER